MYGYSGLILLASINYKLAMISKHGLIKLIGLDISSSILSFLISNGGGGGGINLMLKMYILKNLKYSLQLESS
jgi:hypothetical protein